MSHPDRTSFAALLAALLLLAIPVTARSGGEAPTTTAAADPAMPAMLRLAVIRSRAGEADSAYHIDGNGRGANPRHGLTLAFTPAGAQIEGGDGGFALRLERFGRGDGRPVRRAAPRIDGAWVEYDRDAGLTEWFVNLPRGVEQGWTVTHRPAGDGPLVLELDTARPPDDNGDRRLAWSGLVYHRLTALDADGRELPVSSRHDGARLRIEVDDRDATYPLLVDPWVQGAKLTADDGEGVDEFGFSVALAGDSALVGAQGADVNGTNNQGAAYVFTYSDGVWSQQAKLTADDGVAGDALGGSVALEGDTALVGAGSSDGAQGAAYVFTRSDGVWSQQAKVSADDGAAGDRFGAEVALAGDTVLVGAPFADVAGNSEQGAAYVFTHDSGGWSQQAKLIADDGAAGDRFGVSVALAGDTALVGAPLKDAGDDPIVGAAYVFTRSGETWSQQARLTADDVAAGDRFGADVALASDTALVGAYTADVSDNADQGAAYVFTRSGGVWSQQAKLIAADGTADAGFGYSVTLAGDTALVGAWSADVDDNDSQGAAYIFTRGDGVWSQQIKLTADDGEEPDQFGNSVALVRGLALVGAHYAAIDGNFAQGAAYVFVPKLVPTALAVDFQPLASDGNDVFEPGERVEAAPVWRNNGGPDTVADGLLSGFTGPAGASYDIVDDEVVYGPIPSGETESCRDSESGCYQLEILLDGPGRPTLHWDTSVEETLDTGTENFGHVWTLHLGDSFSDVPRSNLFYPSIETVLHHGVTSGCSETEYCPTGTSTRGQMPVFVLRAFLGPEFMPEPCVEGQERFDDVPADNSFCPWIEELAERGVVQGCGNDNYCPNSPVTRAQMAIFLLKTLEGPDFTPPECQGVFADVPCPSTFADWVEELFHRGVTTGCSSEPLNYCPGATNIRGQMAVFLTKTFGLTLYAP